MGLSQAQLAALLGVSVHTLQDWQQGRRQPSGAAQTLLKIAETRPEVLRELADRVPFVTLQTKPNIGWSAANRYPSRKVRRLARLG